MCGVGGREEGGSSTSLWWSLGYYIKLCLYVSFASNKANILILFTEHYFISQLAQNLDKKYLLSLLNAPTLICLFSLLLLIKEWLLPSQTLHLQVSHF